MQKSHLLNEQLGALQLAVARGKVQRGAALLVLLVHVHVLSSKQLAQLGGITWRAQTSERERLSYAINAVQGTRTATCGAARLLGTSRG